MKMRIFVGCPSDLIRERDRLELVVKELHGLASYADVQLELMDWRDVVPDSGLPEQLILKQLDPTEWDIFIGLLWHRFGSRTGMTDPTTGAPYLSGTQQEFEIAWGLWKKHKRPRILFYECERNVPKKDLDPNQFRLVAEFLGQFRAD